MKILYIGEAHYVQDGEDTLLRVETVDQGTGASIEVAWYFFQDSDNLMRLTEETEGLESAYEEAVYLMEHPWAAEEKESDE
jgi:hypothetical protein